MIAAAVGGLLVVQTVLLCSAAFMVGAIRQERELAVFAATSGATRADLGRVVLAGGLLLGAAGATAGICLGVGSAVLGQSRIQRLTPLLVDGTDVDLAQMAGIWLVGTAASTIAAVTPAVRTRALRPLAALRRAASPAGAASITRLHLVAVLGFAGALVAGVVSASAIAASVGGVGLLVAAPALASPLLSRLEFFTQRARLSVRLAVQDLARHPARSIPTLAALSTALAGAIAVSCFWASEAATRQTGYVPSVSSGHVLVRNDYLTPVPPQLVDRLRAILPTELDAPVAEAGTVQPLQLDGEPVPQDGPADERHYVISDPGRSTIAGLYVASPALVRMLGGEEMLDQFEMGSILTWDPLLVHDGATSLIDIYEAQAAETTHPATLVTGDLPAEAEPRAVVSEQEAERLGLPTAQQGWLYQLTRQPTSQEREGAERAVADHGVLGLDLVFESVAPPAASSGITLLLLVALALAVGVVAVATALSSADLRPDLATLAAVGASKRSRRTVLVTQAVVLSTIAGSIALVVGSLIGIALARSNITGAHLTVPWLEVLTAIAALVALAGAVGAIMSAGNLSTSKRTT